MGSGPHSRKFRARLPFHESQGATARALRDSGKRGQMGDVIRLSERREAPRRRGAGGERERSRAEFFFDLACPFTYLAAERVERAFDDVVWRPGVHATRCAARCLADDDVGAAAVRRAAEERAAALRLPLVWPERFPDRGPRRDAGRRATPPSAAAAPRSCWPRRGWRSAAASTSTIPRSSPRPPPPRASCSTTALHAARDEAPRRRDRGRRAARCSRPAPTGCRRCASGARCTGASSASARRSPPRAWRAQSRAAVSPRAVARGYGARRAPARICALNASTVSGSRVARPRTSRAATGASLLLLGEQQVELGERRVHAHRDVGVVHAATLAARCARAPAARRAAPPDRGVCSPAMTTEPQETTKLHGGRLVARRLKAHGVTKLFTLSGGHLFSIYDGCRAEGIDLVDVRHESAAAFAAEGWAKVTREPGVCALTAGPGVTNGMSALGSAQQNHSPMLVLGGRAPAHALGPGLAAGDRPRAVRAAARQARRDRVVDRRDPRR